MPTRPPVLPGSASAEESPVDRALQLALAGERDAALRWAAAIIQEDHAMSTALLVTGRLLGEAGREEAAREACSLATRRAIDFENLTLAVSAAREAQRFGADPAPLLDEIAAAFCKGSSRYGQGATPPVPLPRAKSFSPLPSVLSGVALINKTTALLHEATATFQAAERPPIGSTSLFSKLDEAGLRQLIEAFEPVWLGPSTTIIEQGEIGRDAYWVARGELEARRTRGDETIPLARLTGGNVFGEMALLSRAPRAGSVVALRPSIVVRIGKADLDGIAQKHPEIGTELGLHCRDRMVENLLRTSEVLRVVPQRDLPALVDRFKIVTFEQHDRMVRQDEFPTGIFLLASGEVAIVRRDAEGDPLVLKSLFPGDVVGEVAALLRRKTSAEVVAVHPTVALFLPTQELLDLVREHPAILAELYLLAIHRDDETAAIMDEEVSVVEEFDLI